MKKLISALLMCGMVSAMSTSSCLARDSALNGVVSKFANEVKVGKSAEAGVQNKCSDSATTVKSIELSQEEINVTDAYFKKLAEKSGKSEDNFLKGTFDELKDKLSGITTASLKEFIKNYGLKGLLAFWCCYGLNAHLQFKLLLMLMICKK